MALRPSSTPQINPAHRMACVAGEDDEMGALIARHEPTNAAGMIISLWWLGLKPGWNRNPKSVPARPTADLTSQKLSQDEGSVAHLPLRFSRRRLGGAVFLLVYFVYFNCDSLTVHFQPDDMMNAAYYFHMKPLSLALAQMMPWHGFYRPLAGYFYLPLLGAFGFNPTPFHIASLAIIASTVFLIYVLARRLGCGELTSALAAILACYHLNLAHLYFNLGFTYDVLVGFFYAATLSWYIASRRSGRLRSPLRLGVFIALFLCALNSKEMATTLPAILLAYEVAFHGLPTTRLLPAWLRGPGAWIALATMLDLVFLYGLLLGPSALAKNPGYGPQFSLARLLAFQRMQLSDILFLPKLTPIQLIVFWILFALIAWRSRNRALRFCLLFVLITPLPIEFLEHRGGACLWVHLIGWAVAFAMAFFSAAYSIAGAFARLAAGPPRLAGILLALIVGGGIYFWASENRWRQESYVIPEMLDCGAQTWDIIQKLRRLDPRTAPNTTVAFLHDPFEDWQMKFIAELWFEDRSVTVWVESKNPHSPDDLARAAHIYDYRDGQFSIVH
jgi:hypothetical protein